MPIELARRLMAAGLASPQDVEAALFVSAVRGIPFVRALLDRGALSEAELEGALAEQLEGYTAFARGPVEAAPELVARLPQALCRRLGAVPTRVDAATGAVEVVASDPLDAHVGAEFAFHLGTPVRVVGGRMDAIENALRAIAEPEVPRPRGSRPRRSTPAFPHGAPESTVPPPPSTDDVAIPLVRRASMPSIDEDTVEAATLREPDDEPVIPLRRRPLRSFSGIAPGPNASDGARIDALNGPLSRESFSSVPPTEPDPMTEDALTLRRQSDPSTLPPAPLAHTTPITARPRLDLGAGGLRATMPSPGVAAPPRKVPPDAPSRPRISVAPPPLPAADPDRVLEALRTAVDRDGVVLHALHGLRLVSRRVAIFAIKRDGFHGWACSPEFGDKTALRALILGAELPSIFATATAAGAYLGPIPNTPAHAPLLAVIRDPSPNVAVTAVRARGRAAMLLVADGLPDPASAMRWLDKLARAAGEALARLLPR